MLWPLSPFPLAPLALLESPRAVPVLPVPPFGAVVMPFIVDDSFHVFARERRLPPCALSFLMLAGPWSARESRSGFVPNSMLADFSDDFAQTERTLCSAGILKRVKGGVRIIEGRGLTVVNAKDVQRDNAEKEAAAEEQREKWKADKQRQRAEKKASQRERIAAGVPGVSTEETVNVHPENPAISGKPQVNGNSVRVDIVKTSTGTTKTAASDDQDLYQDQSLGTSRSKSDAQAREDAALAIAVADAVCAKYGFTPDGAQVRNGIAVVEERARKAGTDIHNRIKYIPGAAAKDRKLWKAPAAPAPSPEPAAAAPPRLPYLPPPAAPVLDAWNPSRSHEFRETLPRSGVCECGATKRNPKHPQEQVMAPPCTA